MEKGGIHGTQPVDFISDQWLCCLSFLSTLKLLLLLPYTWREKGVSLGVNIFASVLVSKSWGFNLNFELKLFIIKRSEKLNWSKIGREE